MNPYLFAINRMIDTLIGIAVAYGINCIHLPVHLQKETLYVSTLDHTLLQENEQLSPYTKVKLRQLLEQGAAITLATSRTCLLYTSYAFSYSFSPSKTSAVSSSICRLYPSTPSI